MIKKIQKLLVMISFPIMFGCMCTFVFKKLLYDEIPNIIILEDGLTFDYIIVGAGTAGSVVAAELSKKSNDQILLIEAGHTFGLFSKVPLLATLAQKTENDWAFLSISQKFSSRGLIDNKQSLPRGKGLGGSSQLNYLLHFEGKKEDIEKWEKLGVKGWSYDILKTYLNTPTSNTFAYNIENCNRNNGFCKISKKTTRNIFEIPVNYSKISEAFEEIKPEFENEFHLHRTRYTTRQGKRWSVYEDYLRPNFRRKNLSILTNSIVTKIDIKDFHVKGVFVKSTSDSESDSSKIFQVTARKDVILSAGAFQTPQILQLSGIGPSSLLKKFNIEVIVDAPNVGRNLYDHMNMPLYVAINESASLTMNKILRIFEIWKYLRTGKGHFGNFGVIGQLTSKKDAFGISIFATGSIDEVALMSLSNFKQEIFRSLFPLYYNSSQEGFVLLSSCLHPTSRGSVRIVSKNIEDLPNIDPNYLSSPEDVQCTIKAIRSAVKVISSKPFQALNPKLYWPKFNECLQYGPYPEDFITNNPNDVYLECIMRIAALTSHHPGGSCSMLGEASNSVIDQFLRVNGVKGLRIMDASIMPSPVSGTPNSVIIALAKRAADIILNF